MAKQTINVGVIANDRKGDPIRIAFQKSNSNFTELYTSIETLSDVAISGSYADLLDIPAGDDRLVSGENELVLDTDSTLIFPNGHLIGTGEGDMVIQSAGGITLAHTTGTPFSWDSSIGIYSNAITMFSGNGTWNFANDGVIYGPLMGGLKVAGYIEASKGSDLSLNAGAPNDITQTVQLSNITGLSDIVFIDLSTYPNAANIPEGAIFSPADNPLDNLTVIISGAANFNNLWELRLNGTTLVDPEQSYIVSYPGTSFNDISINTNDKNWTFGPNGNLTFPDNSVQSTAYTAIPTPASPIQGTFPVGEATEMTVTNSPNVNWTNGTGVFANGINFAVAVDGSGNATISVINDGGTGHFVGETFGPVLGTAFGGATPDDDMYFEVTAINTGSVTSLDLTKQTHILTAVGAAGAYSLSDGVEGQIMYFVPSSGVNDGIYVLVSNARIIGEGPVDVTDYSWTPFSGETLAPTTIAMAIFADGAWCLRGGATD